MSDAATIAPEPPRSTVRAVNCPNCGGTVDIRVAGTTVSVICSHCGSTLDATRPDLRVIARASKALSQPEIALGTRAVLDGTTWEAVGYMERSDGEVDWCEYLLFNPYEGYVFLVDDGRRFNVGRMLDRLPTSRWGMGLEVEGLTFQRFGDSYPVRVTFVVGEFYWRVAVGETVRETDYVCPGTMIACEESDEERTWTRLDLLDWGVAERAFAIPARRKEYSRPAPHEPSPWRRSMSEAWIIGTVAFVTLIVVSMMGGFSRQVASAETDVTLDGPARTVVVRDVVLPRVRNRVSVKASASGLDNAWIDIDYSLTDPKSQDSVDAYGLAEYYQGRDSDGAWSEGDPRPAISLSAVPGGRYDLLVTLQAHKWNGAGTSSSYAPTTGGWGTSDAGGGQAIPVAITIHSGGVFGGNILLGLLAILIWPIVATWRHIAYEIRRKAPISGGDDD